MAALVASGRGGGAGVRPGTKGVNRKISNRPPALRRDSARRRNGLGAHQIPEFRGLAPILLSRRQRGWIGQYRNFWISKSSMQRVRPGVRGCASAHEYYPGRRQRSAKRWTCLFAVERVGDVWLLGRSIAKPDLQRFLFSFDAVSGGAGTCIFSGGEALVARGGSAIDGRGRRNEWDLLCVAATDREGPIQVVREYLSTEPRREGDDYFGLDGIEFVAVAGEGRSSGVAEVAGVQESGVAGVQESNSSSDGGG